MTNSSLSNAIKHKAKEIGFSKVGITAAVSGSETQHLQTWLDNGYMADMAWMANPKRQDISQVMPDVRSVICVALNYYTPHQHIHDPEIGKISRYGWGRDYHKVLSKKLKHLTQWLHSQPVPEGIAAIISRYYVDTGPIAEKALAQRAGIGWIGKHSNIISREFGSWLFLGEILTNLELDYDTPHADHCGTCTRCLTACPTQAIVKPFVVDANRCLAYHTIENRAPTLPPEITAHQENWVAGCDICQDVCPWNQRFAQETAVADFQPFPENIAPSLADLAQMDEATWDQRFTGSALRRIKPHQWRRNASNSPSS